MRVALINPPRVRGLPAIREERYEHQDFGALYPPIGLLQLAALLEKDGHDVQLVDASGWGWGVEKLVARVRAFRPRLIYGRLAFDAQPADLAALSHARQAVNCLLAVRNKIIADVPRLKEELLRSWDIDYFVEGEQEVVLPALLNAMSGGLPGDAVAGLSFLRDGLLVNTAAPGLLRDLEGLPRPAYHLLPRLWPYHSGLPFAGRFAMVQASRGCPHRCNFCAYAGVPHRWRDPADVVAELCWLADEHRVGEVLFFDDLLGTRAEYLGALAQAMLDQRLKMRWACCQRVELLRTADIGLAAQAGLVELALGIESGSREVLGRSGKRIELARVREIARCCRELGVFFRAMVIVGLPGETRQTVQETVEFIRAVQPYDVQYCFAIPFPNTEIYKYFKSHGLLLSEDWTKYTPLNPRPVARTEELSGGELVELRRWAYRNTLFNRGSVWRRIKWSNPLRGARSLARLTARATALVGAKEMR